MLPSGTGGGTPSSDQLAEWQKYHEGLLKDPALTEEDLRAHCKDKLTGYKRPKIIEFRTELPKTNVGKILRKALRDELRQAQP